MARLGRIALALVAAAACDAGTALAASAVGIPAGPVEGVPTETLPAPPKETGAGADTALPQPGLLYAYGALLVEDRNGEPILDPQTRRPKLSGFCQLWGQDWVGGTFTFDIAAGRDWWSRVTMAVDPQARQVRIVRVWGPDVLALPGGGWKPAGPDEIAYDGPIVDLTMPLLDAPEPGWPCPKATWEAQLKAVRWIVVEQPGGGSGGPATGGGLTPQESRERQRRMACDNPQIPGNLHVCHGY
jgi:hypothetical protein